MRPITRRARVARLAAATAAVPLAAAAFAVAAPAQAATGCAVTYTTSDWQGGFTANITIQNLGSAINGWTLTWTFPDSGQKVGQGWSATYSQSGQNVTAKNVDYDAAIATGASVGIGFNGTWTTSNPKPTTFKLNGVTCTGSTTTSTPTATPTKTPTSTPTATPTKSPTSTPTPTTTPTNGAIYVSPSGSSSAAGTKSNPTTLETALTRVAAGGTIYMLGGTYKYSETITVQVSNSGTSGARKTLSAYPGETPILDFSAEAVGQRGLVLNGSYWHVHGIIVQKAGDNGIYMGGSNNVIERVVTRQNADTGLQLGRSGSSNSNWPSNNLIVSSESYDNVDPSGENADGFAAKLTSGSGNVFRYDVAHNNIDDGWDLYTKAETGAIGPVTIENSLSYGNGTLTNGTQNTNGDRNGFKLGGENIAVNHTVRGNIAYQNGATGFTYNKNPGSMTVSDNVSIDNKNRNFYWGAGSSTFRDNTSCRFNSSSPNDSIVGNADGSNQFWTGSNGSRCSSYRGAMHWSFASDGHLVVNFG
ncbi:UNVERIFIED_ORG: hypothetical protein FHR35_007226 [Microbispora rosea subsp. rosea]